MSRQEPKNHNFLMELAVGSREIAIFYRKSEKTARRRPKKRKKQQKLLFVGRRNAESPDFYSSLASETQNRPFSTLRSQAKHKITRFLLFARKRNAESLNFRVSACQAKPQALCIQ